MSFILAKFTILLIIIIIASPISALSLVEPMAALKVRDIDEGDSGLGTISDVTRTSAAFTHSVDDMSIFSTGFRTEVSDEFQVRKGFSYEYLYNSA